MVSSTIISTVIVLFVCLGFTASFMLQDLSEDIAKSNENVILSTHFCLEARLKTWKQRYQLISKYVELINSYFGLILFIFMTKEFIAFITFSFSLIVEIQNGQFFLPENNSLIIIVFFISGWCYLTAIVAVSSEIQSQVSQLLMELRRLHCTDSTIQFQVALSLNSFNMHHLSGFV